MPLEIVYSLEPTPEVLTASIFLAGPSPRIDSDPNWRPEAIHALRSAGFEGTVFVPLSRRADQVTDFTDQAAWERVHLRLADVIAVWCPRDMQRLPGFTTNVEFGEWLNSGRLLYGRPDDAPHNRYLDFCYRTRNRRLKPPFNEPCPSLQDLAQQCVQRISDGSPRRHGERSVPLFIWRTRQFQSWYRDLLTAGNRLDDAEVLWAFQIPAADNFVFCYALKVKVWVTNEGRHKENEFVVSRSDISSICAWYADPRNDDILDAKVVLVREFRSPGRTSDGFVHDLPGGSSFKESEEATNVAANEFSEETGLRLDADRLRKIASRQVCATFGTHKSHLFSVRLSLEEIQQMEAVERSETSFGVGAESERTYIEVRTVRQILNQQLVDHACVGMVLQACLAE